MRSIHTMFALVAVCSVAVVAKAARILSDDGSGSYYTMASTASADPYGSSGSEYTPAPIASADPSASTASADPYDSSGSEYTPAPIASADPYDGSGTDYTPAPAASSGLYGTPAPVAQDASTPLVEETPAPVAEEASGEEPSYYRRTLRRQRQVDNTTADSTTTTKDRPASTTTTPRPSSTTMALPGSNATEESGNATATCTGAAACFHDDDCGIAGDKKGRCIGVFNGKCNCNACINFLSCTDDSACGGLKGACNTTISRCSCEEGFKANGFANFLDTLREFCNVKDCNADNHAEQCFGLPCHSGRCMC